VQVQPLPVFSKQIWEFDGFIVIITDLCGDNIAMKGSLVADEMFPEGAGPYMDIDEVKARYRILFHPPYWYLAIKADRTI